MQKTMITEYYIPERFCDVVALHIAKNFAHLPKVQVPLLLGIHGPKGQGKSFMLEEILKSLGANSILIGAGELESPDAGEPGRLIRLRYREAAELIKIRGKVAVLVIHDIDAGAGRWSGMTQYTVNTQLVNATLMAIADNPTNVQLPGSYDRTPLPRIPIIVTGNDFSKLYDPLTRDGRMNKFFWNPTHEEKVAILQSLFSEDRLSLRDIEQLLNCFPKQSIDFFAAIRSRAYDDQILMKIKGWGLENLNRHLVNYDGELPPAFASTPLNVDICVRWGQHIVSEQAAVNSGLVEAYM
jgi:SpoVK/Ycf46/Vps4 family AAA+-type ATPase